MLGAYTRWFGDWALLVGWAVGILAGTAMAIAANLTPTFPLTVWGHVSPGYTAFYTVILNLTVVVVLTAILGALKARSTRSDETVAADYYA
jgi:SSS family solute:Na+ symporter